MPGSLTRGALIGVLLLLSASPPARGQGSTVQGDVLRGAGQYLRGRGIYELYSARGRNIDAKTEIMIQKWNQEVYETFKRERERRNNYRQNITNKTEQRALQNMREREDRLRNSPTDKDVISGDALNAVLQDLADPSIAPSAWRNAVLELPPGLSIRSLIFQFVPGAADRSSGILSNNLIALGRLDPAGRWPSFMPEDKVGAERRAYEAAHRKLIQLCEKDDTDVLDAAIQLDEALARLRLRAGTVIPEAKDYRKMAVMYVRDMEKATKVFSAQTVDFVREMIRDTNHDNPTTVGELLAFMRKYRLLFASAEGRPEEGEVYRQLFGLLQNQKQMLGVGQPPRGRDPGGPAGGNPGEVARRNPIDEIPLKNGMQRMALQAGNFNFAGTTWDMFRVVQGQPPSPIYRVRLMRNGQIAPAQPGANLRPIDAQWEVRGDELIFKGRGGNVTTIFSRIVVRNGRRAIMGTVQNDSGALHGLHRVP